MFPSPKLGLSLKLVLIISYIWRFMFPSPKLGLSLKLKEAYIDAGKAFEFPSPKLGLSLKSADVIERQGGEISFRPLSWGYL